MLNCYTYTEHKLTGLMTGKIGPRSFNSTAAINLATVVSGGLPVQQDTDSTVAATSHISEVYSEVETLT